MSTTEKKRITVTLTGRPPVRIDPQEWGTIASACTHDGAIEVQANHEWLLRVRQHDDGRTLVYGWERAGNGGVRAGYQPAYAGELLEATPTGAEIAAAIARVAGDCRCEELVGECVADLPAEDL